MSDAETITRKLSGTWRSGAGNAACPICQTEGRRDQSSLSLRDGDKGVLLFCFKAGCSFADIAAAVDLPRQSGEVDFEAMKKAQATRKAFDAEKLAKARSCWERAIPIAGTKAESYLRGRGITIPLPDTLRFLADEYHHHSGRYHAAMVGDIQPTGGVHRTFLKKEGGKSVGEKIDSPNPKLMLGICRGGAVRLSWGNGPLIVCEGIETGLSLVQMYADRNPRVWAALSTSGVVGLKLPAKAGELILAPDGDPAGRKSAAVLAERASGLGWKVSSIDPGDGLDFNDILQNGRAAA